VSIQDQYTNTVRQTQDAWTGIVESLTDNVQAFTKSANPVTTIDPTTAIDQIFDFWSKTLEAQREVAKQIAGASVAASERVRNQAEQVGEAVREQSESAKRAILDQVEKVERAEREQVISKYEDLTKAELQDELAARDLPKSGTVDELRERLVADDLK
jgi:hypothetical protein